MPISAIATSGFSLIAFSTASRPFVASPATIQPRRERRTALAPHQPVIVSNQNANFFNFAGLHWQRNRYTYGCNLTVGIDVKLSADQPHPFLHADDANANFKPEGCQLALCRVAGLAGSALILSKAGCL
jgi:hypothetical protein